jgi:hypothetical protein
MCIQVHVVKYFNIHVHVVLKTNLTANGHVQDKQTKA